MGVGDRLIQIEGRIALETELADKPERIGRLKFEQKFYRFSSHQLNRYLLRPEKTRLRCTQDVRSCQLEPALIPSQVCWRLRPQNITRLLRVGPESLHLLRKPFAYSERNKTSNDTDKTRIWDAAWILENAMTTRLTVSRILASRQLQLAPPINSGRTSTDNRFVKAAVERQRHITRYAGVPGLSNICTSRTIAPRVFDLPIAQIAFPEEGGLGSNQARP
jgi:hypothetical protein